MKEMELESQELVQNPTEALQAQIREAAIPVARFSVDATGLKVQDIRLMEGSDEDIAWVLSKVKVVDPYLEQSISNLEHPTDEQKGNAILVTLAKAEALKREHPRYGERLDRIGRRAAIKFAITATLGAIALAACGKMANAQGPSSPPETAGPVVTQEAPIPTAEPTQTPEPTEIPGSVSSKEILADCPVKIEVETALDGKVAVEGHDVELHYPNIKTKMTFAIDNSVLGKPQSGIPLTTLELNAKYWESRYGPEGNSRQILSDVLYSHYSAWQHDQDNKFLDDRKSVSFQDYLKLISDGGDGSHILLTNTSKDTVLPNEQVKINPLYDIVVLFTNKGNYVESWGGFSYDPSRKILIARIRPYLTYSDISALPTDLREDYKKSTGYMNLASLLQTMSYPERYQKGSLSFKGTADQALRDSIKVWQTIVNLNISVGEDIQAPISTIYATQQ